MRKEGMRLNDKKRFILFSVIYTFLSWFSIRWTAGTSQLKYILIITIGFLAIIFWINTYGKNSKKQIKNSKFKFFLYLLLTAGSMLITYRIFSRHSINEPFVIFFSFIIPTFNVLLFLFFFTAFEWHLAYKKIFLVSNLILGTGMMIYMPPGEVPDEQAHIKAAYRVSNKIMHINQNNYYVLRQDEADVASHDFEKNACFSIEAYNAYLSELTSPAKKGKTVEYTLDNMVNAEPFYIVPGIGISIGRIIGLNAYSTILLGRIFNFIFYTIIVYLAFSILPIGQELMLAVTLLPITLQQVISFSYDAPLFAFSFLSFSITLHYIYKMKSERFSKKDIIISAVVFLILFNIKSHAYFLLGLMPMLVILYSYLSEHLSNKTKKILKICIILTLLLLIFLYIFLYFNGTITSIKYKPNMIDWGGAIHSQEGYSLMYFLKNPVAVIKLAFYTARYDFYQYYRQMIGAALGWLDITLPDSLIYIISILLLFTSFRREDENVLPLSKNYSCLILIISLLTVCFVIGGLAIGWTPVTSNVVAGVQGRYFLPVTLFLYILLKKIGVTITCKLNQYNLLFCGIVAVFTIQYLIIGL